MKFISKEVKYERVQKGLLWYSAPFFLGGGLEIRGWKLGLLEMGLLVNWGFG